MSAGMQILIYAKLTRWFDKSPCKFAIDEYDKPPCKFAIDEYDKPPCKFAIDEYDKPLLKLPRGHEVTTFYVNMLPMHCSL